MEVRKCRAKNALAEKLIAKLAELGYNIYPGYHGTNKYCVGVKVCDSAQAVLLGMELGSGWGDIGFDAYPSRSGQLVVFMDAHVQLA